MKPITYQELPSGDYYKFVPLPGVSESDWNDLLDVFPAITSRFITEDEFNAKCPDPMEIEVRDKTSSYKIGTLFTKNIFEGMPEYEITYWDLSLQKFTVSMHFKNKKEVQEWADENYFKILNVKKLKS